MAFRNRTNTRHPTQKYRDRRAERILDPMTAAQLQTQINNLTAQFQTFQATPGAQGIQGTPGIQGAQGVEGTQGPQGVAGIQGEIGGAGANGLAGPAGPQGLAGEIGPAGAVGPSGAVGAAGANGAQGATGPTGTPMMSGTLAGRPAASTAGRLFYATDHNEIYRDTGTVWKAAGGHRQTQLHTYQAGGAQTFAQAFTTVALATISADNGASWNAATNTYTIPVAGTYLIVSKFRLVNSVGAGIEYGQGVHSSNVDGLHFQWFNTNGTTNQGSVNARIGNFAAGDNLRLFAYVNNATARGILSAELQIILLAQS